MALKPNYIFLRTFQIVKPYVSSLFYLRMRQKVSGLLLFQNPPMHQENKLELIAVNWTVWIEVFKFVVFKWVRLPVCREWHGPTTHTLHEAYAKVFLKGHCQSRHMLYQTKFVLTTYKNKRNFLF